MFWIPGKVKLKQRVKWGTEKGIRTSEKTKGGGPNNPDTVEKQINQIVGVEAEGGSEELEGMSQGATKR